MRRILSAESAASAAGQTCHLIKDWDLFRQAKIVLLYHSLPDELPTFQMLEEFCPSKKILLPVVTGENMELRFYEGKDSLRVGAYSILEPAGDPFTEYDAIDLCLIPGVAFDKEGTRLGRGKGYYDRLLPSIKAPKAGLCYECQLVDCIPSEPHDIRMDYLITEERFLQV